MRSLEELRQVLTSYTQDTLRGTFYRATQLAYFKTLTGTDGGWRAPNRYSRPELSHALYLADGPDIAMSEATRNFQKVFSAPSIIPAYAIYPVEVELRCMLDLTHPPV